MGFKSFYVREKKKKQQSDEISGKPRNGTKVDFNKDGSIKSITTDKGKVINLKQKFGFYIGHVGDNRDFNRRASGAYIFRPKKQTPDFLSPSASPKPQIHSGPLLDEVQVSFGSFVSQSVRIYHDESGDVEFDWVVGPIPVNDQNGKVWFFGSTVDSA